MTIKCKKKNDKKNEVIVYALQHVLLNMSIMSKF